MTNAMPMTIRLSESKSVPLDDNGNGVAAIVCPPGQRWRVTSVSVYVTPANTIPDATLYRGEVAPANRLDGTESGANDTTDVAFTCDMGHAISVEWLGGDAGAIATMTVQGERVIQ